MGQALGVQEALCGLPVTGESFAGDQAGLALFRLARSGRQGNRLGGRKRERSDDDP